PFKVGQPFTMEPRSARLVELTVHGTPEDASGDVSITQYRLEQRERIPVGGAVFRYRSKEQRWREQPLLWLEAHYLSLYEISRLSTGEDRE
ncbi:MAG: hypothetical protein MJA32_03665, partial [Proteobacteria bacterium]|nr:hypothetical protein [Pseudomonadota bacterium]